MKARVFPPIPDYLDDAFVYLDAQSRPTLIGRSGAYWMFVVRGGEWSIDRPATKAELDLIERAKAAQAAVADLGREPSGDEFLRERRFV